VTFKKAPNVTQFWEKCLVAKAGIEHSKCISLFWVLRHNQFNCFLRTSTLKLLLVFRLHLFQVCKQGIQFFGTQLEKFCKCSQNVLPTA